MKNREEARARFCYFSLIFSLIYFSISCLRSTSHHSVIYNEFEDARRKKYEETMAVEMVEMVETFGGAMTIYTCKGTRLSLQLTLSFFS